MADLVITAAAVVAGTNTGKDSGTCGETITAGQAVFKSAITGKWMLADNNAAGLKVPGGIALNSGALNQPLVIAKSGDLTMNAALTAGVDYFLSATPGGICPRADVITGMDVALLGLARSTTVLMIDIQVPGVTLP